MNIQEKIYNVDRKTASRLLRVSVRTVDRYVKSKKLSTKVVNGRVWLDKAEVKGFGKEKERPVYVDKEDLSMLGVSVDDNVDEGGSVEVISQDSVDTLSSTPRKKGSSQKGIYKILFDELKEDLREKQERLEIANYRVGQLEAQVRNSVPMLEYHRENYEKGLKEEDLNNKIIESTEIIKRVTTQLRYTRLSKKIYIAIILIVIALQPLWLLALYK